MISVFWHSVIHLHSHQEQRTEESRSIQILSVRKGQRTSILLFRLVGVILIYSTAEVGGAPTKQCMTAGRMTDCLLHIVVLASVEASSSVIIKLLDEWSMCACIW